MKYQSWGRYPLARHEAQAVLSRTDELPAAPGGRTSLPFGQGRSYGDSCLNDGGAVISTAQLNHFIDFDRARGILRCEAGVTLEQILQLVVPQGWFLPVTPGTKYVSVGGAIANDVHGKNHHRTGTFGRHVRRFELLRSGGRRMTCSAVDNAAWFGATVGGLGLTGLIVWAEIQLKPIANPWLDVETIKFNDLKTFFALAEESEDDYEYTVAWVDCLAHRGNLGRGHFIRANHAPAQLGHAPAIARAKHLAMPLDLPAFALNRWSVRAFNTLYFHRQRAARRRAIVHYEPFFYPLDAIRDWNRIYGRRGFVQYQCVVPYSDQGRAITEILQTIANSRMGSFLSVLKTFGDLPSPGLLSFPRKGVTLALDFPYRGDSTLALLEGLDKITRESGGAVYPAKDARMSALSFQTYFPQWRSFTKYIDPNFSSSFWRRVTLPVLKDRHEESTDHWSHLRDCAGNG